MSIPRSDRPGRGLGVVALAVLLAGCTIPRLEAPTQVKPSNVNSDAVLTPVTRYTLDLTRLPPPRFRIPVAVYSFRDQTGQFKQQPDSNLSNMVTQGAASILVKALLDSGWYLPIEREGFQNLLNERRVARALEVPADRGKPGSSYPSLIPASFVFEGGIIGYETNVRTGGVGANLLGVGAETKYRIDQVTVILRSVDVRTGQIANAVSVTKTIFSHELSSSVYRFVSYKTLLQAEGGYSTNEPSQLAVKEAIEAAVIHLTLQGVSARVWSLRDDNDWGSPLVQAYMRESALQLADPREAVAQAPAAAVGMREAVLVRPPSLPIHMQQVLPPVEGTGQAPATPPPQAAARSAPAPAPAPAPAAGTAPVAAPAAPPAPAGPARSDPDPDAAARRAAEQALRERIEADRVAAQQAAAREAAAAKEAAAKEAAAKEAAAKEAAAKEAAAKEAAAKAAAEKEAAAREAQRLRVPVTAPPAPALAPPDPAPVPGDKPALDIVFTVSL